VEVDTLKVPDGIKATPQEYRTTIREMAKGESLTHPMVADQIKRSKSYIEAKEENIIRQQESDKLLKGLEDYYNERDKHQESMSDGNVRLFQTQRVADGLKKMMEDC
jgi:hypothetical protein